MPNFLENIFAQLKRSGDRVVLREVHGDKFTDVTGAELLQQIQVTRTYLRGCGLQRGDRCAIVGPNFIRWVAIDLALMAEGFIVVPLYWRQAAAEVVAMMKDCQPRLLFVSDPSLGRPIAEAWHDNTCSPPRHVIFDEVFVPAAPGPHVPDAPNPRSDTDLVTIVYTSGTSGEPKGVCLNTGNVSFMLSRTTQRLAQLMHDSDVPDSVFHYLPLNFAASWIALLSFLSRNSAITLSTDLNRLADEILLTAPHYFLNVPTLLERVRRGVDDAISKRPTVIRSLFTKVRAAWQRRFGGNSRGFDAVWLALGRRLIFNKIKERFGPNLRALICGSAPLAPETQQFFLMLDIPVLQVYGLTETTGICTMDDPRTPVEPGHVGPSIDGIEMKIAENEEIVVRGPHIFPGYWNRADDTAQVLRDGWFHTGDQGETNAGGNWRIIGRLKNLIILNSGHNIAPEPLEERLSQLLPGAQQVVLVGNARSYLSALVTGSVEPAAVEAVLAAFNCDLPHYRQIRNFALIGEPFTSENGLLTSNGKLRREAINARLARQIDAIYDVGHRHTAASGKT